MIVLDANIPIRALLGRKVRQILENYSTQGIRFLSPDLAFDEAAKYLPALLEKRGLPATDVPASLQYLRSLVAQTDQDSYIQREPEARARLRGRDEKDWPILATALVLGCPIWTEDTDFFGTGVALWTTNRVEIFLEAELGATQSSSD